MTMQSMLTGLETICILSLMHSEAVDRAREHPELKCCVFLIVLAYYSKVSLQDGMGPADGFS